MPRAPRPPALHLLHVDDWVVVVDKPAGLLSVPGRGAYEDVPARLRALPEFAADEPLRIVHRLDRDASGVLLFARGIEAQRRLVAQFMSRTVEKIYGALVTGYVTQEGEIDVPLGFDKRANKVVADRRGKPSQTHYRVLERVAGNTWLECRPITGRRHQIRVHLAAIGHPLAVDPDYGGGQALWLSHHKRGYRPNRRDEERPLIDRLTLHACRLSLRHPATDDPVSYEAPLPKDLRVTLKQLGHLA